VVTLTRTVTVGGAFAPGHLGELTAIVPFELVDAVLAETKAAGVRTRELPSRVGVYFLLAMRLFPEVGYLRVWAKLTAGLHGLAVALPTAKALRDLRRRVGAAAVTHLIASPTAGGRRCGRSPTGTVIAETTPELGRTLPRQRPAIDHDRVRHAVTGPDQPACCLAVTPPWSGRVRFQTGGGDRP
jgi:hypothetical protein